MIGGKMLFILNFNDSLKNWIDIYSTKSLNCIVNVKILLMYDLQIFSRAF